MSGFGAVLLFIFETFSLMSATMMVTGFCSGRLLWSALRSTSHDALVLCDVSLSHMIFQFCSVSALGGSVLISYYLDTEHTLWMVQWRTSYLHSWLQLL